MPSTYSTLLRLEKQAVGENNTTWGTKLNTVIDLIEAAIGGRAAVTHSDAANYSLTTANSSTDEARNMILNIGGAITAARNTVVPTSSKLYIVKNATTGGYTTTLKTTAGTGIVIPNGKTTALFCDSTNVVNAIDYLDTLTVPDANFAIVDDSDQTKIAKFQCSGITTGTTRAITLQDVSGTMYVSGGTDVPLLDGGTNASLTAANGGIVYSTATAFAILAATATAGQMLRSGSNAAPTWSTATFPATATGTGTILRADGTNWVASSATYPDTITANYVPYATGTNVLGSSAALQFDGTVLYVLTAGVAQYAAETSHVTSDPSFRWTCSASGVSYVAGLDNSDADKWELCYGTAIGTTPVLVFAGTGAGPHFPTHRTTAEVANAYYDSGTGELYRSTSSMRYKKDALTLSLVDAKKMVLGGAGAAIIYKSNTAVCTGDNPDTQHLGIGAEAVAKIDKRLVQFNRKGEPEYTTYDRFVVPLCVVVANHEERISALETQ